MKNRPESWTLVLAGGEGSRLRSLTRDEAGTAVPKQFCSLRGGPSLLTEALQRARSIAPLEKVCTIVAAQHRQWWAAGMLDDLKDGNVFVQPHNRGTAHGILLPLLRIAARDPDATVVLLPADHYFGDEDGIAVSLRRAAAIAQKNPETIHLLGVEPNEADTGLGYILPSPQVRGQSLKVARFEEKPRLGRARRLLELGALWNVFIVAASVRSLLTLFGPSFDATVETMRSAEGPALDDLYRTLPTIDFSRHMLEGNESRLRVLRVPTCGWTDLGTPDRIASMARQFKAKDSLLTHPLRRMATEVSLMERYLRTQHHFDEPHPA